MTGAAAPEPAELVRLLVDAGALAFGEFTLKSGRQSPYFFNLASLHTGAAVQRLGEAYAGRILATNAAFDCVFGPAYKGIPLAVATAEALARQGRDCHWAFNRKEPKDHGEGGVFVGGDVSGRVMIVDDVLTAGTAIRESVALIRAAGGTVAGVVIALDRRELGDDGRTAVQALADELEGGVHSLLTLEDVIGSLDAALGGVEHRAELKQRIEAYREAYCARL